MQLKKIIDHCSHLSVVEERCISEEFVELVFINEQVDKWAEILTTHLGPPRKPSGQAPSDRDLQLTSHTGGIRIEQTLFEKEFDNATVIAKFWPWKDNNHTTLRMALLL